MKSNKIGAHVAQGEIESKIMASKADENDILETGRVPFRDLNTFSSAMRDLDSEWSQGSKSHHLRMNSIDLTNNSVGNIQNSSGHRRQVLCRYCVLIQFGSNIMLHAKTM